MKILPHSIRWRIQLWHGLLLLAVLIGLGVTAYRLQWNNEYRHLDEELRVRTHALHDALADPQGGGPGGGQSGAGPGGRGGPRRPGAGGGRDQEREANREPGRARAGGAGEDEDRPARPGRPPREEPPDGDWGDDEEGGPRRRPTDANGLPDQRRAPGPGGPRLSGAASALFSGVEGNIFYYRIWGRNGDVIMESTTAPADIPLPVRGAGGPVTRSRNGLRETYNFTPPGECLLVGISESALQRQLSRFATWLFAIGGVVMAFGLAGGWWLASRAIAPIAEISATAMRIADGQLEERIDVAEADSELGHLATVLNNTFQRLEAAFAEQARFTSDAAHELRTPISVILAQTQLALARPRTPEEYVDTINTVRRSGKRMQELIESLLTLAIADVRSEPMQRKPCDLAALGREHLDLIRPLASERGIVLQNSLSPAPCSANPDRIGQILVNLISNAVKYCRTGDEVRLISSTENGFAVIKVADTGPGIAAEHLPHLFERFYRADASRNRNTGGAGLGLAICKTLAEAHQGTLDVTSTVGVGTTFTLRIPVG